MKVVRHELDDRYTYFLARSSFELTRSKLNLSVMLSHHLNDESDDFLNSPLFNKLCDECVEKAILNQSHMDTIRIVLGLDLDSSLAIDENCLHLVEMKYE